MTFPEYVSFTITNDCNLNCRMCGQWSEEGYMRQRQEPPAPLLQLSDWTRLVDELAAHGVSRILLRGGEPFRFPDIIPLLEYAVGKGVFVSIDTNGTLLGSYAADIVRIGHLNLTISVDGPEPIHDHVRGLQGAFAMTAEAIARLNAFERRAGRKISKAICFVISPWSLRGLGQMPDVARRLGIDCIAIVPYYYIPEHLGKQYEEELKAFGCEAYSWRGFHHEASGVDLDAFRIQLQQYRERLHGIYSFPYMDFSDAEYAAWFSAPDAPAGSPHCANVERLIDIQPNGDANFCVDFPDYTFGNVKNATIEQLWNSPEANRFRACRRQRPFAACHRCGAKYMAECA